MRKLEHALALLGLLALAVLVAFVIDYVTCRGRKP